MLKYTAFVSRLPAESQKLLAKVQAAAVKTISELYIYDLIDVYGFSAVNAVEFLNSAKGDITIRMNSPGGDVMEAVAIFNAIQRYKQNNKVTVIVDGLAASAASLIALSGTELLMAENALFMIHMPWCFTMGDAHAHAVAAELLDKVFETTLLPAYVDATGMTPEEVSALCAAETWYTAEEAVAAGFADGIEEVKETPKVANRSTAQASAAVPAKPALRAPLRLTNR